MSSKQRKPRQPKTTDVDTDDFSPPAEQSQQQTQQATHNTQQPQSKKQNNQDQNRRIMDNANSKLSVVIDYLESDESPNKRTIDTAVKHLKQISQMLN